MRSSSFFKDRKVLIATKHQKEKIIGPLLKSGVGLDYFTSDAFDTDLLGTFSGEIERKKDALNTLREKCRLGMEATGADLVVASEGSFGPHPTVFLANANEELLMLIDYNNDLEIIAREISLDTNIDGKYIQSLSELNDFCDKVGFPDHGLILKLGEKKFDIVIKDIATLEELEDEWSKLKNQYGEVYVETDMRAHRNPTRRRVIQKAAEKLIEKLNHLCPACEIPGFDIFQSIKGLPCSLCSSPTNSILKLRYKCSKCSYEEYVYYPRGIKTEDPTFCDYCNP